MKTQTQVNQRGVDLSLETARIPDTLFVHPELERVERMAKLADAMTCKGFKDNLTICTIEMLKTGKANTFAVYENPDEFTISDPVLPEREYVCRFGMDPTKCVWREETGVDELLRDDNPRKQQILCKLDEKTGALVPRDDVLACVVTFPMGGMESRGLNAKDLLSPTRDLLKFFWDQNQLHPGFTCGVLTHDGTRSGMILFKQGEDVQTIDTHMWERVGTEDGVSRSYMLPAMEASGMVYTDIDLNCPKSIENTDPEKWFEQIEQRYARNVAKAVGALYEVTHKPTKFDD